MFKYGTLRLFFAKIIIGAIFIAFSLMLFLSLISFSPEDPGFKKIAYHQNIHNYLGYFGAKLSSFMLVFWGHASYIILLFFFSKGLRLVLGIGSVKFFRKFFIIFLGITLINLFITLFTASMYWQSLKYSSGNQYICVVYFIVFDGKKLGANGIKKIFANIAS